jgi:SAM-dependent methyltransferase
VRDYAFDERSHAGAPHLHPLAVERYDAKAAFDPTHDVELLRGLVPSRRMLVDLGAGTGTFALAAARDWERVVAVDAAPAMVEAARVKTARAGTASVDVVEAGFLTYEHGGRAPDAVYSRNALHHLPELWKATALRRIATLLAPGGVLRLRDLVLSCEPDEAAATLERWLDRAGTDPAAGWTRGEIAADLRDEHVTFAWLLEPMLEHAGFEIVDAEYSASRTFAAYTCVRRAT